MDPVRTAARCLSSLTERASSSSRSRTRSSPRFRLSVSAESSSETISVIAKWPRRIVIWESSTFAPCCEQHLGHRGDYAGPVTADRSDGELVHPVLRILSTRASRTWRNSPSRTLDMSPEQIADEQRRGRIAAAAALLSAALLVGAAIWSQSLSGDAPERNGARAAAVLRPSHRGAGRLLDAPRARAAAALAGDPASVPGHEGAAGGRAAGGARDGPLRADRGGDRHDRRRHRAGSAGVELHRQAVPDDRGGRRRVPYRPADRAAVVLGLAGARVLVREGLPRRDARRAC